LKKLILRNSLSPGDIVVLTAAVRDLHLAYPGQFAIDVRTSCAELWENNPRITPLSEDDPEVENIQCEYPLINQSNTAPYHFLHGFIDFINERLDLRVKPTLFKGDIHLSAPEKSWRSQVSELTGKEIPFWIIDAGGKCDASIKWWSPDRYQAVVNHFRGKIQFVQVGSTGHHHPKLQGVIDLRGRTTLRELVRLVYHSQGVVCPVTSLMHLAAAVETKPGLPERRACVVVAGAREPAHWEAYPNHQFIATNGLLPCCAHDACWRARTIPLGDGDRNDEPDRLCVNVAGDLPRCMDMISAAEVIRRIEAYFTNGVLEYLRPAQARAGRLGVSRTITNDYDDAPLSLPYARLAFERFAGSLPAPDSTGAGRGVVICAGGMKYFPGAWVCVSMLRKVGCALPVELWHLGADEFDPEMASLLRPMGVVCVDALAMAKRFPVRNLGGRNLKPYAILNSSFQEVLYLDADNLPVANPENLFATRQYRETGAIFWPDFTRLEKTAAIWTSCNLPRPPGPEFEAGQIVVDKGRCWPPLRLALWLMEQFDFYQNHLHGDDETFHLAFHKLRKSYGMVQHAVVKLDGAICQHDFEGRRLFQHRNGDRWNIFLRNREIAGFLHESDCRKFIQELSRRWSGRANLYRSPAGNLRGAPTRTRKTAAIAACMISCPQREQIRNKTLRHLAATDWGDAPILLQIDPGRHTCPEKNQTENSFIALQKCLEMKSDYILFLEDDLEFNRFLRHNLDVWAPLQSREFSLASLYNPDLPALAGSPAENWLVVSPKTVFGSQAFLVSRRAAKYILQHWEEIDAKQDIKMSRLAARLDRPLFYHAPSLVQHIGTESSWGGNFHQAPDFDRDWRARGKSS
jgi:ADP-heptose:LPS heptosyltransferase